VKRRISDHSFRVPRAIIELWLLFPIVTQIEPPRVVFFDKRDFPAAAPTFQFLLACDRVIHVAKVLKPNEPIQTIAFRKVVHLAIPMLVQRARDIIRHPNVQRGAVFVGENVHPIVVVAHEVEVIRDVSLRST
jgi:hypothetical protein